MLVLKTANSDPVLVFSGLHTSSQFFSKIRQVLIQFELRLEGSFQSDVRDYILRPLYRCFGTDEQVRIVFRSLCSTCVQTNITVIANFLPQQSSGLSGTLTICYTLRVKGWHQLKVVMAVAKITD